MEDKDIIQLYFDRNEDAISATDEKYGSYCMQIARNILDNVEDSNECVSDTYLKTWNTIPPSKPSRFRVFLGKITRNVSFDRYRKEHANKRINSQITLSLDELGDIVSGYETPEEELDKKELVAAINAYLSTLPKEKCVMFVRRYWHTDSISDIADRCGLSKNNVAVNLNRLRKQLREYLLERGFEL